MVANLVADCTHDITPSSRNLSFLQKLQKGMIISRIEIMLQIVHLLMLSNSTKTRCLCGIQKRYQMHGPA